MFNIIATDKLVRFPLCCVDCELGMSSELDLKSLWKELDAYEEEMKKETKSLQEVWLKIAQIKTKNESDLTE